MNRRIYTAPKLSPKLFYSEIKDWQFQEKVFKDHGKYCIRFKLTFSDGRIENRQIGGLSTKKEAIAKKNEIISRLYNREYVAYPDISVKDFYDYWLYHHIMEEKQSSYNVFMAYRNIINNYIYPKLADRKFNSIKRPDLVCVLAGIPYKSVLNQGEHVLRTSMKYAKSKMLIEHDFSVSAIKDNKQRLLKEEKEIIQDEQLADLDPPRQTYSISEICRLLSMCKMENSTVFLPLLVALTTGIRISEQIALKFENIDTWNKVIYIEKQLGRQLEFIEKHDNVLNKEVKTKSRNSVRKVNVPDYVLDELLLEFKRRKKSGIVASSYVFCGENGSPLNRSSFSKEYKRMALKANVPVLRWHDLRHTYATLLYNNQVNLKEISTALGHATEYFTKSAYIEEFNEKKVITVLDNLYDIINESLYHGKELVYDISFSANIVYLG